MALCLVAIFSVVAAVVSAQTPPEKFFNRIDTDGDGAISPVEYYSAAADMLGHNVPSYKVIHRSFHQLDQDGDGVMTLSDFLSRTGFPILESSTQPVELHLALTSEETEMRIVWISMTPPSSTPSVQYGPASSTKKRENHVIISEETQAGLIYSATPTNRTYNVGIGGFHGIIFDAVMTGLTPGARYTYRVGSDDSGWSQEYSFTANSRDTSKVRRFAIMGDMGTAIPLGFENAKDIALDTVQYGFDSVVHVGDLCYAGTGSTIEVEYIWDIFGGQTEGFAAITPYMTGVGNHEHYYNYTSYLTRYHMPAPWGTNNAITNEKQFWFSFNQGGVHFTMMSTEHPYEKGSQQYEWLEKDLSQAANDDSIEWIFLTGHRPMYSTDMDELSSHVPGAPFQREIEPLMIKYGVDAYFCGHQHAAERIHPVNNGTVTRLPDSHGAYVNPGAPFHMMLGVGGTFTDHSWLSPSPPWSAYRGSHIGYGRLTVFNATTLTLDYVSGHGDVSPNDGFTVIKVPKASRRAKSRKSSN